MNKVDKKVDVVDQRMVQDVSLMREAISWLFGCPFSYLKQRNGVIFQFEALIILCGYAISLSWPLTVFFLIVMFVAFFCQILSSIVTSKYARSIPYSTEGHTHTHTTTTTTTKQDLLIAW